jgi:hypothetical protein
MDSVAKSSSSTATPIALHDALEKRADGSLAAAALSSVTSGNVAFDVTDFIQLQVRCCGGFAFDKATHTADSHDLVNWVDRTR